MREDQEMVTTENYHNYSDDVGETAPIQCQCNISEREEQNYNFILKELVNDVILDENLTVKELVEKRHPNIRVHLLDFTEPRCSLIPYFTG